ncbi:MAG: GGDEF domain-containing protein [Paludibacterium sp.]|uniref:GGDEF domain-containing protein n=1 Tax=Paludibacterium sp. TaxID=1917523 RepID=UPI0025EE08B9|nr:GGDEF domain-containing protein [Paludibacterium sp.]MBV8046012.1 GGDEF domain-containing protein [Paludibacterium sp.]MBV8647781.1 GGDEF domain-containing protein [Paludibacterium sp.]
MRMRLVYLTCTLLWLVISVLIGLSFVSHSVLRAEEDFDAFEQHLAERIGQQLEANEVVLYSYAAFQSAARTDAETRAFADNLVAHHQQIKRLFTFDAADMAQRPWLMTLQQAVAARHGGTIMQRDVGHASSPSFFLARAIDPSMRRIVVMQVEAAALLAEQQPMPPGWSLWLWQGEQGDQRLLERHSVPRHFLEQLLLPAFNATHPLGGTTQPMTLQLSWQLGWPEVRLRDGALAAVISIGLFVIMFLALARYARFLEGSQEREMRLFYLANHDRLTNLANRNLFYDRLQHAISRLNRKGRSLAVLFLDMDRFKPVNDTYGHATGDRVLQVIAARLKAELRTEDTVARLGGDEFAVLIEEVESKQEVILVVERLKRAIERAYELDGHSIRLGVSIGVAYYPEDGVLIEELLSVADRKMYGEKNEPLLAV